MSRPTAPPPPALLTVAHGTRDHRGEREMSELVALLRARHPAPVENGWLEDFARPDVPGAVARLSAQGAGSIVSVPVLLLGARHAKTDVPAALAAAAADPPAVVFAHARVLGLHAALFALARARVAAVGGPVDPERDVLLVTGSGSSDPDANADLAKAARFLAEGTGHRWVDVAFAGVTWPTAEVVLRRLARAGARRVVLFSWSLLAGLLERRVTAAAAAVAEESGVQLLDAGRFGPDPLVADVILERYREALEGDPRMNCDLCAYRVPLPGLEERVAAPSAGGTGGRVGLRGRVPRTG